MRLIDADRRWEETECEDNGYKLEYYQGIFALYNQNGACICEFMPNLPTAYDIDKVVDELEEMKTIKGSMKTVTCRKWDYGTVNRTIEIVKQGGEADDYCEWKHSERFRGMETYRTGCCGRTMILTSLEVANMKDCPQYAMKYCPYCGKKIKAVE